MDVLRTGMLFSSEFDSMPGRDDAGQTGVPECEAPGKGERILVVDDFPGWREIARTRTLGCWVSRPGLPGSARCNLVP